VKEDNDTIQRVKADLGEKPEEASKIIKCLNSKNKYELEEPMITGRIETILEVKKVIFKRNLMIQLDEKCQNMKLAVNRFFDKFEVLRQNGFPNPLVINDKLLKNEDYDKNMREVAKETSNTSSMKGVPTKKCAPPNFRKPFYLQHEVNHLFVNKPTFAKYTEEDEIYQRMMKIKLPDEETWEKWCDLL